MRFSLRRLSVAPFQTATALAAVKIGIPEAITPAGVINAAIPTIARGWSIGYALAGVLILVGLTTGRRAVEVLGLIMLACGVVVQAVAVWVVAPDVVGWLLIVTSRLFFAGAALSRAHTIAWGRDVVQIDLTDATVQR